MIENKSTPENTTIPAELFIGLSVCLLGFMGLSLLVMCFTDFSFWQSAKALFGLLAVVAVLMTMVGALNKLSAGSLLGLFIGSRL
ncbi:hypothetical protein NYR68_01700 [Actinobacillus equuli subsp. haemolyticus]|uniref:hypothetical protein n=1 Tax=Actinobacillus equuli TaxID=718 RepID=UPI002446745C|nr:hypothetical protein [Actinobacillus equuli]WGE51127.1 hypothetical protein NYR68_01700 [Actinobacillus equuli subsp. haemolyticus]